MYYIFSGVETVTF